MENDQAELDASKLGAAFEAMLAGATLQMGGGPTLQALADDHPAVVKQLAKLSAVQAAAAFGGLLTVPALQANCLRLEALVHLALMSGNGHGKPSEQFVRTAFQNLGQGFCGRMEDPAEDLFVHSVRTPRGNFRVLEGIWEGNAFYLQRFVNVVEGMPAGSGYDDLRDEIYALLKLSDRVCERAHLRRNRLGDEMPLESLSKDTLGSLGAKIRRIRFPIAELLEDGVEALAPFMFGRRDRALLAESHIGNSTLERCPLVRDSDYVYLVLPTAVGSAIRYHVLERMKQAGMLGAVERGIADEYASHFADTQLLGGRRGAPISFQWTDQGAFAGVTTAVDKGRYLNLIFMTDDLADLDETGIAGVNPDSARGDEILKQYIDYAYGAASQLPNFVDGISLVVGCGIGRGVVGFMTHEDRPNWRVEFISAHDLDTLSWLSEFKPISLWRLLDAGARVEAMGTALQNVNGLLNLVAWSRSLDGHLVPHADMPDDYADGEGAILLMVDQNGLRALRHEVATLHDACVAQDIKGDWIPIRRDHQSDFADDRAAPLYASEIMNAEGWLMSVYLAPNRAWWAEASFPPSTPGGLAYERWRVVTCWLSRAVPILDQLPSLPAGPVKWRAVFEETLADRQIESPQLSYEEARREISVSIDSSTHTITTYATKKFEEAIHHPENIAERALVDALIEGVLMLAGQSQSARDGLLSSIVRDPNARHAHAFAARGFRDFVHSKLNRTTTIIDRDDDAAVRLGLGWTVRDKALGGRISGKDDAVAYLNSLVTAIEDDLCVDLRAFNREALLSALLLNYETAAFDRDRWRRTAAAVLALHEDEAATFATIGNHEFKLNGVFQATRILIEMGLCESPLVGGRAPGKLDLSRLMAKTSMLFHLGGWSDAIRWDVMEPIIRVTPLGDVHAKLGYVDEIITPHARESSDVRIKDAIGNYAQNLKQPEGTPSVTGRIDEQFLEAWEEDFGASFQDMRVFIDWLEDRGISLNQPVMRITRADFVDVGIGEQKVPPEKVSAILDKLTLRSRPRWRDVPEGFLPRDRQPWRFRRRLSAIRRPIFEIGDADETYLVAPGLVREAFAYTAANYMRGDFPSYQLGSKMRAWAGREADKRGAEFTNEVAAKLQELGWQTETEIRPTKILRRGLDRDYGDVDVLAWKSDEDRVLLIECKDVQFRKTYGEICEQLADFRGEMRPDGKPDYLLRHLQRVDLLRENETGLAGYLSMGDDIKVESHLVFKNPVPMKYALERLSEKVRTSIFSELPSVLGEPRV